MPNALDLMVVCVEAGLTLDASLQRVGNEIAMAHPGHSRQSLVSRTWKRASGSRI